MLIEKRFGADGVRPVDPDGYIITSRRPNRAHNQAVFFRVAVFSSCWRRRELPPPDAVCLGHQRWRR
jgi:hypothetical protein